MRISAYMALLGLTVCSVSCLGAFDGEANDEAKPLSGAELQEQPVLRLSRIQYRNTVRDILGAEIATGDLPVDDEVGNFRKGIVLSPSAVEKYLSAAITIADAIQNDPGRVVPCAETPITLGCAQAWVGGFLRQAYRRAPSAQEQTLAEEQLANIAASDGVPEALHTVISGVLVSPRFLYLVESWKADRNGDQIVQLDGYSIATRLSYLVWNSAPNDALLTLAENGSLDDVTGIRAAMKSLLADPRARDGIREFYRQWLEIGLLDSLEKDESKFPDYSEELRDSMRASLHAYIDEAVWSGGTQADFFASSSAYVDSNLAKVLGVSVDSAAGLQKIDNLPTGERRGILTQPGMIALLTSVDRPSIIHSGYVVLHDVLCEVLPEPPADVGLPDDFPLSDNPSPREFSDARISVPNCSGCHQQIDPVGYTFLNYAPDGSFRTRDEFGDIDSSGEVKNVGADVDGAVAHVTELAERLSTSKTVAECMVRQWMRFALGRKESSGEKPVIDEAVREFQSGGSKLQSLMEIVATSDAFRFVKIGS